MNNVHLYQRRCYTVFWLIFTVNNSLEPAVYILIYRISDSRIYVSAPVFTGNTFQDLPRLRETADNTKRYIQWVRKVAVHL
jgi:hypothetical protein